jgi:RIO kinase 1
MRLPAGLQELLDEAIIDDVVRQLKSGKEASVYSVRCGNEIRCAKVYKDMAQRSFKQRAQYQEGRKTRGSRDARAMSKSTRYGRKEMENAWKNAEVDALYQLAAAGVRVPRPYGFFNGVLIMEMVIGADGDCAPRLGEVELSADVARDYHRFLIGQITRMLVSGLIHGDLSQFNVLVDEQGPVIIDLPQAVNAAGNNNAFAMLERDVQNITDTLSRFAPELQQTNFAAEMWELFEQGELKADSVLTGVYRKAEGPVDVEEVVLAINDAAREEMLRRERESATDEA